MPPVCDKYTDTLARTRALIAPPVQDVACAYVRRYLEEMDGAGYDPADADEHADEFTAEDIAAVGRMGVRVAHKARPWLLGEDGDPTAAVLLAQIPNARDLWEVTEAEYDGILGRDQDGNKSPAWRLWDEVAARLDHTGHSGRWVTAFKLLHRKRPRLLPIYDQEAVSRVLNVTRDDVWEALWCTFRHADVRENLEAIRAQVSGAGSLSLIRVLDIIVWTSVK